MKNNNYNSLKTASKLKNWLACNYTTINEINEKELKIFNYKKKLEKRGEQFEKFIKN